MPNYVELSPEAETLLAEIIEHENVSNYWKERFEKLSRKEDTILRGCFRELKKAEMISVQWGDDIPYFIEILKDGYMYNQHKKEEKMKSLSEFERQLADLMDRERNLRIVRGQQYNTEELDAIVLQRQIWINDVVLLYDQYLKKHPLGLFIYNTLNDKQNRDQDMIIRNLLSALISISKDKDFISQMQEVNIVSQQKKGYYESEYDVFISHANSDKNAIVDRLNKSLENLGIRIFYDKKSLEWGDNWKNRILEGTKKSEFAIIVISENFFGREWTEKELNEFLNRQNSDGQKLILPILYNITIAQLKEKYPSVADIQGISTKDYTCDQIALLFARQLIQRLRSTHIQ